MVLVIASIFTMIVILGLASVGGMITEKSGIINLSIEGFMTIGAVSYSVMASRVSGEGNQIWMIPFAGLITATFSIIYGLVTVKFKANQTIAGIALNSLALAISIYVIHSNINPVGPNEKIQIHNALLSFGSNNRSFGWILNIAVLMGLPVISLIIIFINKTKEGKMIKAVGENPHAAASLGVNVEFVQMKAIMISAFVTGMAGALFAQKSNYFFGSTQGLGFLAVALVIFGQWNPKIIFLGALLFGSTYGLIDQAALVPVLKSIENKEILQTIPYIISLGVLIVTSKNSRAPKALGIPYKNAGR